MLERVVRIVPIADVDDCQFVCRLRVGPPHGQSQRPLVWILTQQAQRLFVPDVQLVG